MGRRSKGEGTIFFWEEKKLWVGKITLPDGKKKVKYGKTQKEVKDWLLEARKALKDNTLVLNDRATLAEFLDRYMEDYAKNSLRPATYRSYANIIRWHILPDLGKTRLSQLKPEQLNRLYAKKLEAGLSTRTVQYIHGILRRTLNKAVKWGVIYRNPTDQAEPPANRKKEMKVWTPDEVKKFLNTLEGDRWKAIYYLACVGLRQGEILGLKWPSLNLEDGNLKVVSTVQFVQGMGLVFGEPKTDQARRLIELPEFVVEALKEHQQKQDELKKSPGWQENHLVFTTDIGTAISPRNLVRHFKAKTQEAGLPEIRFHDLRHTTASLLLLNKKVHPKVVQELLGHSTITLTLDTYSHIIPTMGRDAADSLDSIFK